MPSPETVSLIMLLLRRVCAYAGDFPVREGRLTEVLQRIDHNWSAYAALHLLQLAANARSWNYGGRATAAPRPPLVGIDLYRLQSHAVRSDKTISRDKITASKSRIIPHVRLFQFMCLRSLLLASAGNQKPYA